MSVFSKFGDWASIILPEIEKAYFMNIIEFLDNERRKGKSIFPEKSAIFRTFELTKLQNLKVVIIGQDPYHNLGQANGLAFSVAENNSLPPSLKNIFKELQNDIGIRIPLHGNLSVWANQGVLLLNTTLTVEANKPLSHSHIGWNIFTDHIIKTISSQKDHLVFILWGKSAQSKIVLIDKDKHLILQSAHPSPLSSHRGFFGCQHFSQTNKWLMQKGIPEIDWCL